MKKVAVLGLGYVGLPTLTALAKSGKYEVIGFDINESKVELIKNGGCPIDDDLCAKELKEFKYTVTRDPKDIADATVYFVCVPTPVLDDYTPDYGPVLSATSTIAPLLKKGDIFILESTVNPGTNEEVVKPKIEELSKLKVGEDITLAHCPERINPGDPKWNIYNISRNLGVYPFEKAEEVAEIFRSFLEAELNICSSLKVAESTKIVENTFRDVNIAFVNELAQSFDKMGIDLIETIRGASNKPFGFMPFWPGRGVGGHCIAVDPYYLIKRAEVSGFNHRFLKTARDINNNMPIYSVIRLQDALNEVALPLKGTKIATLGMSYKPNVGDLRESPSIEIKDILLAKGADLRIYDPWDKSLNTVESLDEAIDGADAVAVLTAHDVFSQDLQKILDSGSIKVFFDGMNKFDKDEITKKGLVYRGIGR
ncbi:nucleotide sugar dehydrogenase [Candidatus Nomurabacteria bacterium]|nr:nucleotide sugar dehydrogenase [Candidatus Nomurabacteria bacterium]MCB9803606.1 nucleotide sugar dehydrogenase [Candidatus Nomurabacteria bacterium]